MIPDLPLDHRIELTRHASLGPTRFDYKQIAKELFDVCNKKKHQHQGMSTPWL